MGETAGELRRDLDEQRARIGHTVDEIENRVVPGRVWARRRYGVRQRIVGVRERVMGSDDTSDYYRAEWYGTVPPQGYTAPTHQHGMAGELRDRAGETAEHVREQVQSAPQMARQRAQGAPIPAGILALSAGFLVGSLLPPTRRERQMAQQLEPTLETAAHEVRAAGSQMVDELREPAKEAVHEVQATAGQEGHQLTEDAREAASRAASQPRRTT